MPGLDYSKWDALSSSDDEQPATKSAPVQKQATRLTAEEERAEAAENASIAQEYSDKIQNKIDDLVQATIGEGHTYEKGVMCHGQSAPGESPTHKVSEEGAAATVATSSEDAQSETACVQIIENDTDDGSMKVEPPCAAPRRRGMDRIWAAEAEQKFGARTAENATAPDGGRGEAIAKELRGGSWPQWQVPSTEPSWPAVPEGSGDNTHEGKLKSSLRRLNKVDDSLAHGIELECGVNVHKADVFRLIIPNQASMLQKETKVLLVVTGATLLCEEPISEECAAKDISTDAVEAKESSQTCEAPTDEMEDGSEEDKTSCSPKTSAIEQKSDSTQEALSTTARVNSQSGTGPNATLQDGSIANSSEQEQTVHEHGDVANNQPDAKEDYCPNQGDSAVEEVQKDTHQKFSDQVADKPSGCSAVDGVENNISCSPESRPDEDSCSAQDTVLATAAGNTLTQDSSSQPELVATASDQMDNAEPHCLSSSADMCKSGAQQTPKGGPDVIEAELCFFRAMPKRGALGKKLGAVPVLHVALVVDEGKRESMEFIGVHQRRYCAESTPTDAISRNLVESLLQVALEFVFHPSRSKYATQTLVIRECSTCQEVRRTRDVLLPGMVDRLRQLNNKIKHVEIEYCSSRSRPPDGKGRSFLIFDEDVLKVVPSKTSGRKAPSAKGSFKGLGQGFLNTKELQRKGLGFDTDRQQEKKTNEETDHSSSAASSSQGPPPIQTYREDRRRLLLPAADLQAGDNKEMKEFASKVQDGAHQESQAVEDTLEEEADEPEGAPSTTLSELANQLFGNAGDPNEEDDNTLEEQTDSTQLPSPKASSCGENAASERSEPVTEDGGDLCDSSSVPAAGIRLLQQRRKAKRQAQQAEVSATNQSSGTTTPRESESASDDLVKLWMKQRW